MNELKEYVKRLESYIPQRELQAGTVSAASVGWHIEHALLAMQKMAGALTGSDPADYKWKFNFPRMMVLSMGKIPRGRGKAPGRTMPLAEHDEAHLRQRVVETLAMLPALSGLTAKHHFVHPVFGDLNLKQGLKTMAIHTRHHLSIIEDIVKQGG
jgi:hypothetical protein